MRGSLPDKVEHGGKIRQHMQNADRSLIDFSASLNPFPPKLPWHPETSLLGAYPDDHYDRLKNAIAGRFGRKPDEISVGNGSIETIRVFCQAALAPGDGFYIDRPTFGEYGFSARLAGGMETVDRESAVVRFLCNPNNPTGTLLSREEIRKEADRARETNQILFVDEAFIGLADPLASVIDVASDHLFVLRSLTKSFAVPGIRFGFGCGSPSLISQMETIRPPWTVNAFAEDFALTALNNCHELEKSREQIAAERRWLYGQLESLGLEYTPSATNFILIELARPAAEVTGCLMREGFLVRDCTSFGLPSAVRIAIRTREENQQLIEALSGCLR